MTSQLLINEPPLQVLPTLAQAIGLNEAIVLQQVHYWLNPQFNKNVFDGRHWVHNTFTQWQGQFKFWSSKTIKRTIAGLEESGLLIAFVTRSFTKTKYYTLNYDLLNRINLPSTKNTTLDSPQSAENKGVRPWGQNVPLDGDNLTLSIRPKCPSRWGQPDPLDRVKVTSFHYTENTTENTSENTLLPPLSPLLPRDSFLEQQEEEEEKEINFELGDEATKGKNEEKHVEDQNTTEHQFFLELIAIWNQTVQSKLNTRQDVCLTGKRKTIFKKFLQEVFLETTRSEQLDAWQDYCTLIAKSAYLRGQNSSGFKVTLEWALVPDNAFKVLEGIIKDSEQFADIEESN